jgi:hypothetical protein
MNKYGTNNMTKLHFFNYLYIIMALIHFYIIRIVTIQPIKTCLMILIMVKLGNPINNLWKRKKRRQLPTVYENQFVEICRLNFNKDGY